MRQIYVCIGSGCHLKGSYEIIAKLKQIIAMHGSDLEVRLAAAFCQGRCTEGVVIKIDDQLLTKVNPQNIEQLFLEKVLQQP